MPYGLRWTAEVVFIGQGQAGMSVPDQQKLSQTNFPPGNANGGLITIPSTGNFPLSGNISTACTTMATNAAAAFNASAVLAQIQGFATGGG